MPSAILAKHKAQYRRLNVLVCGAYSLTDRDAEEIGKRLGASRATVYNYLKAPEQMPLDKLLKLCKALGIPEGEVKECIRY